MSAYYAVCDANGPISRRIEAEGPGHALDILRGADRQAWVDAPSTDAEDDLDIDGEGMSAREFAAALEGAGLVEYECSIAEWSIWGDMHTQTRKVGDRGRG